MSKIDAQFQELQVTVKATLLIPTGFRLRPDNYSRIVRVVFVDGESERPMTIREASIALKPIKIIPASPADARTEEGGK